MITIAIQITSSKLCVQIIRIDHFFFEGIFHISREKKPKCSILERIFPISMADLQGNQNPDDDEDEEDEDYVPGAEEDVEEEFDEEDLSDDPDNPNASRTGFECSHNSFDSLCVGLGVNISDYISLHNLQRCILSPMHNDFHFQRGKNAKQLDRLDDEKAERALSRIASGDVEG